MLGNREIKFRAWDKERQEMRQVQMIYWSDWWVSTGHTWERENGLEYGERNSFKNEQTDRHNLMQYTGLEDTEGAELYEGDIVLVFITGECFEIIWDTIGTGFLFSNTDKEKAKAGAVDYYEFEDIVGSFGFRKVGNIYEHPHLLKEDELNVQTP